PLPNLRKASVGSGGGGGRRNSVRSLNGIANGNDLDMMNTRLGSVVRRQNPSQTDIGLQIGEWLARAKMQWMTKLRGKSLDLKEQEVDTLASIIRMYRGIQEEEVPDHEKVLPDRGWFEIMMGIVVMGNMIVIGLELEAEGLATNDRDVVWIVAEAVFCFAFVSEEILGKGVWRIYIVIAFCVFLDCAIFHPLGIYSYLRMVSLLRVLGLIGLRRTFAQLHMLEELSGVLDGLMTTAGAIFWVLVLCFFFLYMSSVFVTEQIGHNLDYVDYRKISGGWDNEELFGTIGRSMFTLLQMMTLDSWSSQVARHVINMQWEMGIEVLAASSATVLAPRAAAKNDRKARARLDSTRKQELDSIKEVFVLSDRDGSGEVDLHEFLEAVKNPEARAVRQGGLPDRSGLGTAGSASSDSHQLPLRRAPHQVQWRMRALGLPLMGAAKLFAVIDGDGSRTLTITEFINGCKKLKGTAQSKDLLVIQAQADILSTKMEGLGRSLEDSARMMTILDAITSRTDLRFASSVEGARRRQASNASGMKPMKPIEKTKSSTTRQKMTMGNCPALPLFPDLLR
ncbi:unnamed protein product, partial [Prorocentrum cordatum]